MWRWVADLVSAAHNGCFLSSTRATIPSINPVLYMRNLSRQLPPLSSLVAFDAAARNLSFKQAAQELNLTQAAISRQIRLLEENLGVRLFLRSHRAVRLTPEGRSFAHVVAGSLAQLANGAEELRTQSHGTTVAVAADLAIASFWLMPRLSRFRALHPDISIRVVASDEMPESLREEVDVTIQLGKQDDSGQDARFLFEAEVFPVCSPDFLARHPGLDSPEDLLATTLLRLEDERWDWMDWQAWFTENHVQLKGSRKDIYINNYPLLIQAALSGQGVALGWNHLIQDLLDSGMLTRPVAASVHTRRGFYLLLPESKSPCPGVDTFCDWVIAECRNS